MFMPNINPYYVRTPDGSTVIRQINQMEREVQEVAKDPTKELCQDNEGRIFVGNRIDSQQTKTRCLCTKATN